MKKNTTPTFLLELPLRVDAGQAKRLRAHFEAARCLYNALLGEALKRLQRMRADPSMATCANHSPGAKAGAQRSVLQIAAGLRLLRVRADQLCEGSQLRLDSRSYRCGDGTNFVNACLPCRQSRLSGQSEKSPLQESRAWHG